MSNEKGVNNKKSPFRAGISVYTIHPMNCIGKIDGILRFTRHYIPCVAQDWRLFHIFFLKQVIVGGHHVMNEGAGNAAR